MEEKYGECHKRHKHLDWMTDGCLAFVKRSFVERELCGGCGCHRSFHRKLQPPVKYKTEVVYTKCRKIHDFKFENCADGCQEFIPTAEQGAGALVCTTCGCNKGFHRNEITTQKGDEKREQLRLSNRIETNMEDKYAECKNHHWDCEEMTNVTDGCQEYMASESDPLACVVCGCHRNFHRKVTGYRWDVVYTKCHKVHDLNGECKVDGCREFFPGAEEGSEAALFCATCGCHKGFHRNEIKMEITSTS